MTWQRAKNLSTALLLILSCGGCALHRVSLESFHHTLARGEYRAAQNIADGHIGRREPPKVLLWELQAGAVDRLLRNYSSSNRHLDQAEDGFRFYDQQVLAGKSAQYAPGIFFNDSALPYTGTSFDRTMVNTYKAINYAILGDAASARVEFNRALQRQNEAKTLFAARAEQLRTRLAIEQETFSMDNRTADEALGDPELNRIIRERYKNLNEFKVYADFVNPFATYMAGLFFWLEGDTAKAVDLLKEAYAMSGGNSTAASDFARAARGETPAGELWVVFENGLAPRRGEMRIDLPLLQGRDGIQYIGAAFPILAMGEAAYSYLSISATGGGTVRTEPLADMDAVVIAEFRQDLPAVTLREITRVLLKAAVQYQMQKNYGIVGGVTVGVYQAATTAVDIRSWTALPKNFQLAHLPLPSDRALTLTPAGGADIAIKIPTGCKNVILYVRAVSPGLDPVYDFILF